MKKWNPIRAVTMLCMVLLIFSIAAPAFAVVTEEIEARQQELEEIEKRRRDQKNALELRLNREAALREELKQLEFNIEGLQLEQEKLAFEIRSVEKEIEQAEADLAAAEERLKSQEDLLKLRLRAIQQHGVISYLEVLFESSSFPDFLTRLHSLSTIANNDLGLIEQIKQERDLIKAWKEELELKKTRLENMRRQVAANEQALENAAGEREIILDSLRVEISANLKAIKDLEYEAQQLDTLIRKLIAEAASEFSGLQGALHWPIESPTWISSNFGWRRDPFSGARAWHGGVDIAPHHGAANYILAAAVGQVIFAGWKGGYGNCLMIDHGNGTVTLYAHMSSLLVGVGEVVTRGQSIGRAGTTGFSTGVHLHFEVREYNKPPVRNFPSGAADHRHNPMGYF
jgi:murein DD-endopeptidase MepM/ murein hydrolase activator NlpD